jgi:hypothetical protein
MKPNIPNFNDTERWVIQTSLKERYGRNIETEEGESEIRIHPDDRELTLCPVLAWKIERVTFVIFKTGLDRYRSQFFMRGHEQFGTGIEEFDNIADCVTTVLQIQADYVVGGWEQKVKRPSGGWGE